MLGTVNKSIQSIERDSRRFVSLVSSGSGSQVLVTLAHSQDADWEDTQNSPRLIIAKLETSRSRVIYFGVPGAQATFLRLRLVANTLSATAPTIKVFGLESGDIGNYETLGLNPPPQFIVAGDTPHSRDPLSYALPDPAIGTWHRLRTLDGEGNLVLPGWTDHEVNSDSWELDGRIAPDGPEATVRGAPVDVLLRGAVAAIGIVTVPTTLGDLIGTGDFSAATSLIECQLIS